MDLEEPLNYDGVSCDDIRRVQRDLDSFEYGYPQIDCDEYGNVIRTRLKSAAEVSQTKSCICMDGVFYAARNLRERYGEMFLDVNVQ